MILHEMQVEIWCRIHQRMDEKGYNQKQILLPKSLRAKVMVYAGGHLGVRKTENKIRTNFFGKDSTMMSPVLPIV